MMTAVADDNSRCSFSSSIICFRHIILIRLEIPGRESWRYQKKDKISHQCFNTQPFWPSCSVPFCSTSQNARPLIGYVLKRVWSYNLLNKLAVKLGNGEIVNSDQHFLNPDNIYLPARWAGVAHVSMSSERISRLNQSSSQLQCSGFPPKFKLMTAL